MDVLTVSGVTLSFGGLQVLSGISLTIEPELITSIIGPNGAGKTSLLNCISGFYHPAKGDIHYGDCCLTQSPPHRISSLGIARAFQNIELFRGLSVLDNLMLARHQKLTYGFMNAVIFWGKASRIEAENRSFVEEIIDFMELEPYRMQTVGSLSYGVQKRAEVARALAPKLVNEIFDNIRRINQESGTTILVVEQNAKKALSVSDYAYIMESGQIVLEGESTVLANNPDVKEFYLGITRGGGRKSFKEVKSYKRRKRWM